METQAQQQTQSQSVKKRSAQELRETRNKLIQMYAQKGISIKSLTYLFSLSEQTIRGVLQGTSVVQPKQASIEQLEAAREIIKKNLTQQNYTSGEIEFIVGKGSLAQAETIRNLQEQIKYYKGLEMQYHTDMERLKQEKDKVSADWQKKYDEQAIIARTFLASGSGLEQKLKDAEKENGDLRKRLKDEMNLNLNLGDKLLEADKDNIFLKEGQSRLDGEIEELKKDIEDLTAKAQNLEQEKQEAAERAADLLEVKGSLEQEKQSLSSDIARLNKIIGDLTAEIQGLEQEKAKINADWTKMYNNKLEELQPVYEKLNQTNRRLLAKVSELEQEKEGLQAQVKGLEQQLLEAEQKVTGIETEKEELTAEIEGLRQKETESCIKIRYTDEDINRMVEVYKQSRRNKSKTLEILHNEGIMISYRHLIRILQKRGFKSTKSKR